LGHVLSLKLICFNVCSINEVWFSSFEIGNQNVMLEMQWTPYLKQIEFFLLMLSIIIIIISLDIDVYNAQFMLKEEFLWAFLGYGH